MRLASVWKRQYLIYCISLLALLSIVYSVFPIKSSIHEVIKKSLSKSVFNVASSLTCHYLVEGDLLPSIENPEFSPGDKRIFFHETSCLKGVNSRQACSIESAARLHPTWQINVVFSAPVTKEMLEGTYLSSLLQFQNVKLSRLHMAEYGKDTPVEEILRDKLNKSAYPIEHAADILRIVTLRKFGGVYLDTDCLLIKNFDSLPSNWIAKESNENIASGAMAFSNAGFGVNVTDAVLREIRDTYDPKGWSTNGPLAIQRVLVRLCPQVTYMEKAETCEGLQVFPSASFYPVHYSMFKLYFNNGTISTMEGPYMHHMWNFLSKNTKIEAGSPYAKLAKRFCPTIYETYIEEFGS